MNDDFDGIDVGRLYRVPELKVLMGPVNEPRRAWVLWRTAHKKFHYVVAVVAIERDGEQLDLEKAMERFGWVRKPE
jgi:hypothetical protein